MRFRSRITFVKKTAKRKYNPDTGQHEGGESSEVSRPCVLLDAGLELSQRLFGGYEEGRKVALVQQPYTADFDYVMVDGVKYRVKSITRQGRSFVLERDSIAR